MAKSNVNKPNTQAKEVKTMNYDYKYEFIPIKSVKNSGKSLQFKIGNDIYLIRKAISSDFTEHGITSNYTLCIKQPKVK